MTQQKPTVKQPFSGKNVTVTNSSPTQSKPVGPSVTVPPVEIPEVIDAATDPALVTVSTAAEVKVEDSVEDTPPTTPKEPPTQEELEHALWRAKLHLRNLEEELDMLLLVPKMAGPLRQAAANEKCQIPGNACNWSVVKTIRNVIIRVMKEVGTDNKPTHTGS